MKKFQFAAAALSLAASSFVSAAPTAIALADFAGGGTVVDFNTIPDTVPVNTQYTGLGVTFGGALLGMTNGGDTTLFNGSTIASNWNYTNGNNTGATWTATFSAAQTMVGFWVETNAADSVTIEAFSGVTSLGWINFPNPNGQTVDFIGLKDAAGFDRISVTTAIVSNGFIAIDDFRFGGSATTTPVSAPGTLLLSALGLAAVGAVRRRTAG